MTGSHDRSEHSVPEQPDIEDLVVVGRVRRPTGIDGTLLIEVYSGDPKRFSVGDRVFIDGSEHEIVRTGASGKSAKIKLAGIDSIEKAGPFRGEELAVTIDSLPDNPPGVYYHYEILGIDVVTLDGQRLGTLTEVVETGSNDVFVVSPDGDETRREAANEDSGKGPNNSGEILIPVLDGVIVAVDKENGVMTIDPPAGLI